MFVYDNIYRSESDTLALKQDPIQIGLDIRPSAVEVWPQIIPYPVPNIRYVFIYLGTCCLGEKTVVRGYNNC